MRQQDVHDELRARLHEAAEAHEPDRARILARIERGMAPESRPGHRATLPPVVGWIRVVSATAAVAAVLGVGGYAVASAVKPTPTEKTVAVSPTPSASPDATSRPPSHPAAPPAPATPSTPSSGPSPTPSSSPKATAPVATGERDGPLWSEGSVDPHSNDFWAQSDVTLKTTVRLTSLTVRLQVAQTGGVSNTGAWRSLPETDFTQTAAEQDGFLVYTWTLKPGREVAVGDWVFAGQYNHRQGGRNAEDDTYTITGGDTTGKRYALAGDFATRTGTGGGS